MNTWIDDAINVVDGALKTLSAPPTPARAFRRPQATPSELSDAERRHAAGLMRVNHVGEVCAQALYTAQAFATRSDALRENFLEAAGEERDHLAWTAQRLEQLDSRPSALNLLWYGGAFAMGLVAGRVSDRVSLGFVVETERQVEKHLESHLDTLPAGDVLSRAIVLQMRDDEARHGQAAQAQGAAALPMPVRLAMRLAAKIMTKTAYWI